MKILNCDLTQAQEEEDQSMVVTRAPEQGLVSRVNALENERIPNLETIVREIANQYGARLAELERTIGIGVSKPIVLDEES